VDARGIAVTERDINKQPPDREFLERHVDEDRFWDFVSTRSPVFKARPLPRSKKEAIALVLEGSPGQRPEGVIFGFDRARYERL
jgi:arsenate reductase-like glutaredoxin family protein